MTVSKLMYVLCSITQTDATIHNGFFYFYVDKEASVLGDFVHKTPYQGSAPGSRWGPEPLLSPLQPWRQNDVYDFTLLLGVQSIKPWFHVKIKLF